MISLLLAIIYVSFISLGLPDSLLGSAWPAMQMELSVPLAYAGIISMLMSMGTVVSSLQSDRLTKKFGTGVVTAVSVMLTAMALMGFSLTNSFAVLCLLAIPYGLGAGAVDAALNNFVALHFASRHMSWLHCFWGVGAAVSPYIMSHALTGNMGWSGGYRAIALLQIALTIVLFLSLPLWKKSFRDIGDEYANAPPKSIKEVLAIPRVPLILIAFFSYCALETTTGLWATSFLVESRGIHPETAARFAALYYIGITVGRFLCGFVADKLGDRTLIRIGLIGATLGIFMIWLPLGINELTLAGLIVVGLGSAPIYPSVIHSTPANFGPENSQAIIGVQMASAYLGNIFMPPLFGIIAQYISISIYPFYLAGFVVLMVIMTERLFKDT